MVEKKKSVDEAIDEVAEEATAGLSGVKDSLAKAQASMENAKAAMQDAYGKAKEKGGVAADRAKVYMDDAKKYMGEAREKMGSVAAKSREQAEVLYGNAKEQYESLSVKGKDLYGRAKTRVSEVDFKQKGDDVVEYVRANPGKAVLIALAVGFLVGYATRPRD